MESRAQIEVETLLKVVLVLVVVWIALEILELVLDVVLGPLTPLLGVAVVVLVVLWLRDRI